MQFYWRGLASRAELPGLQSLCSTHHYVTEQREEDRGFIVGNDCDGRPTDPSHPWNALVAPVIPELSAIRVIPPATASRFWRVHFVPPWAKKSSPRDCGG